jgi:transposase, IS30 family
MEREWSGNARRLSQADRREIERRIRAGETFEATAAAVGCSTKSIQRFLALTGGIRQRIKERSPLRVSLAEREEISLGLVSGESLRSIARRLGRSASTISREVAWRGRSGYRAWRADVDALERGRRPKPAKLALDSRLRREVVRGLLVRWSPQQIAARLRSDYPDDVTMRVSRDDLPDAVRAGARSTAQGIDGLLADGACAAPATASRTVRRGPTP